METTPVNVDAQEILSALEKWINKKPGLDWRDYGADANGRAAYRSELRSIAKDKQRALKALDEARNLEPRPELLIDSFRAFSGRLEWYPTNTCGGTCDYTGPCTTCPKCRCLTTPPHLEYTTGQYWPTEYRKAAASVLETYIAAWRQAYAAEHPQTFTYRTMDDVKAANQAIGNHWFDRSTMRFFSTKIESGLIAGKRFITSERCHDTDPRRYTVREAQPDGTIDTIGDFCQYRTRDEARAAILKVGGQSHDRI